MGEFDVAVVGSGPNGLAAAAELTRHGLAVQVVEQADVIGGGTRTEELTLPGFRHDVCSAVHPTGIASPFFTDIGLDVDWIHPDIPLAHPLGDGDVVALYRDLDETADQLGSDASRYRTLIGAYVDDIDDTIASVLGPMVVNPRHKSAFARVAAAGGMPASVLAAGFSDVRTKALIGGLAAHAFASLSAPGTAGVGLFLGILGHASGWPIARGGSSAIASDLARRVVDGGGDVRTGEFVRSLAQIDADQVVLDVMPPAALQIAGERFSTTTRRRLAVWRPGPAAFKVDFAVDAPIPWLDPLSGRAGTVHLGGTFDEIASAEGAVMKGEHPERPYVLVSQPSLFDPSRAPDGNHTVWAYCHVPNGSTVDMEHAITDQIERFAPGFRDTVLATSTITAPGYQAYNPNYVGGDIGGGRFNLRKVLQLGDTRPFKLAEGIYIGSSAVPPGAGVHGMCGYLAARAALADR